MWFSKAPHWSVRSTGARTWLTCGMGVLGAVMGAWLAPQLHTNRVLLTTICWLAGNFCALHALRIAGLRAGLPLADAKDLADRNKAHGRTLPFWRVLLREPVPTGLGLGIAITLSNNAFWDIPIERWLPVLITVGGFVCFATFDRIWVHRPN